MLRFKKNSTRGNARKGFAGPRAVWSLAASVSLALVLTAAADLNLANIRQALDRQAQLVYERGVRFANDLSVAYQVHSLLKELPAEVADPPASTPPTTKTCTRS